MTFKIQVVTATSEKMPGSALISHLADEWRDAGHTVSFGPAEQLDADVGVLHINRTWVDDQYVPKVLNGRLLLNGNVLDISKRRFSDHILKPDDDYDGPIMIKTNGNCFEQPERGRLEWLLFYRWRLKLANAGTWRLARELPGIYPVVQCIEDVPQWVWSRKDLVVEKFMPEMDGDLYVLRMWVFFGDREFGVKMWSSDPMVKADNFLRFEYLHEVPEGLRPIREKLQFDFGKFDYVMVNGEAVLLDINTTPTIAASSGRRSPNIANLAEGIRYYLESSKN